LFLNRKPLLRLNWHYDEKSIFVGCTDGSVKSFDVESGVSEIIGHHEGPVKGVHWLEAQNALLTLSFDHTLRFWDPRQAKHIAGFQLHYKPLCSDVNNSCLVVGMSEAKLLLIPLGQLVRGIDSLFYMDAALSAKSQLTSIKFSSGMEGIITGGHDGRSNLSKVQDNPASNTLSYKLSNLMTWKAPRDGREHEPIYPINSLGFHPKLQTNFAYTTSGDGKMHFWDTKKKAQIAEFDFKGNPVTKAEIDPTGKFLAYALGYDWARGIQGYQSHPSKVCVHVMEDKELEYQYQGNQNYPLKY